MSCTSCSMKAVITGLHIRGYLILQAWARSHHTRMRVLSTHLVQRDAIAGVTELACFLTLCFVRHYGAVKLMSMRTASSVSIGREVSCGVCISLIARPHDVRMARALKKRLHRCRAIMTCATASASTVSDLEQDVDRPQPSTSGRDRSHQTDYAVIGSGP